MYTSPKRCYSTWLAKNHTIYIRSALEFVKDVITVMSDHVYQQIGKVSESQMIK